MSMIQTLMKKQRKSNKFRFDIIIAHRDPFLFVKYSTFYYYRLQLPERQQELIRTVLSIYIRPLRCKQKE